jgi:hypothetical protein
MCNSHFLAMAVVICLSISRAATAECADANVEAAFRRQDIPALRHIIDNGLAQTELDPIAAAVLGLAAYREAARTSWKPRNRGAHRARDCAWLKP